jgi:hypothetical protein
LNRLHPTQIDRDDETQALKDRNTSPNSATNCSTSCSLRLHSGAGQVSLIRNPGTISSSWYCLLFIGYELKNNIMTLSGHPA